jgi:hypothetical protein
LSDIVGSDSAELVAVASISVEAFQNPDAKLLIPKLSSHVEVGVDVNLQVIIALVEGCGLKYLESTGSLVCQIGRICKKPDRSFTPEVDHCCRGGRTLDRARGFMYVWTNVSHGNASEEDLSFPPRFAYRTRPWPFEML